MEKNYIDIRGVAGNLVHILEPDTGSKMLAYEKAAAVVGVSASWLRKFITVAETPEPRWSVGQALLEYYDKLCSRVGQQVIEQRGEVIKMIGEINEADPFANRITPSIPLAHRLGLGSDD
jgi:hypothetical protein